MAGVPPCARRLGTIEPSRLPGGSGRPLRHQPGSGVRL